jgi:hypothetical protein
MLRACLAAAVVLAVTLLTPAARAQDIFTRDTFHGLVELRAGAADGERSWVKQGFGKTAFSGDHGGWKARADISQAVVEWKPRFSFSTGAVISGQYQSDAAHPRLDLDEAYLSWRSAPSPAGRISARVGIFYPPLSLENAGVGWTTTDLLSASALNTWVGEEVKVSGLEASFRRRFGGHELTATAAVFGWNDTSGTLLSFRGWALGEARTGFNTRFSLPPLSRFMRTKQAGVTSPMWELDGRAGYYGRLEWRPPAPVVIDGLHYDNRGDRIGVHDHQWAWQTRFDDLGVAWTPTRAFRVRAQALTGRTWMGYATPHTWLDMSFRAAYLMATHDFGDAGHPSSASLRFDLFDTHDHTWKLLDNNNERGWAATVGLKRPVAAWADLFVEAQRVESHRPARVLAAAAPHQAQTVVQTALRLHF